MDNNMIRIDDLVKQRLANSEEEERAGAWSNMKALLDDQMPVKPAVPMFNWRRAATVAAGLVLVAALSMGGYELMTSWKANDVNDTIANNTGANNTRNNTSSEINTSTGNTSNNLNTENNLPGNQGTPAKTTVATENKTSSDANDNKTDHKKVVNKSVTGDMKVAGDMANPNTAKNNKPTTSKLVPSSGITNNNAPKAKVDNRLIINKKYNVIEGNNLANNQNIKEPARQTITPSAANKANADANTAINKPAASSSNNNNQNNRIKEPNKPKQTARNDNGNIAKQDQKKKNDLNTDDRKEKMFKDSINMIATKEKYSVKEGSWKLDTVEQTKVARYITVGPVDPGQAVAINNDIIPSSALNADEAPMEPLEKKKVAVRKTNNTFGNAGSRFDEMVKSTKYNLSKVTFHSGVMGGVNSSIASSTTMGFQLGIFGSADFSEHVSLFAELKYMQRWGGSNVITDNYNNNKQEAPASTPGYILHTWDSVDHSFNYPTLNSVRVPIAVRYAFKRFSMFCGADFGYNFGVNAEEISQPTGIKVSQVTPLSAEGLRFDENKVKPGITFDDFSSRMEIGGMLGVSYNFTPATMIDVRVVQSMWSNAKTPGQLRVYEALYNNPCIQFNIRYRFSNNKFRAYRRN